MVYYIVIPITIKCCYHHHHPNHLRHADEPGKIMHVEVNDWGPEHADLRWSKPETDGGSPITGYVIEFRVRSP